MMHPDTLALLLAAIRTEVESDPTKRGYNGKTIAEIAALLNALIVVQPAAAYRDVSISDVRGYLEARLVMVRLEDWINDEATPRGTARDAARTLLRITTGTGLSNFTTSTEGGRANILGLFGLLVQIGAGGLTAQHLADLTAMTVAPAGAPVIGRSRWATIVEGISTPEAPVEPIGWIKEEGREDIPVFHPSYAGPPNAVGEAMVAEALA